MAIHYYPLINKMLAKLNLKDSMLDSFAAMGSQSVAHPFITVAREPGSGGEPVAKLVAERLGFKFIDEEIIEAIARSTKKRKAVVKAIDEKSRTAVEDVVRTLFTNEKEYVSDYKYIVELAKVILAYAFEGKSVILGRGANFITPFAKGLHVYVTAPYKVRVQRAMDFEGHDKKKAKQVIGSVEKERKDFVKKYLRKDINKKNSYDIILNTTYFSVEQTADVIIEAFYKKCGRSARYKSLIS